MTWKILAVSTNERKRAVAAAKRHAVGAHLTCGFTTALGPRSKLFDPESWGAPAG
jgi:hypothetical protein